MRGRVGAHDYPLEPEAAPAAFRGQVQLDPNRCRGDAACARVCPSGAITVEETPTGWIWQLDDSRCVFCGLCADACANQAISLSNAFELAVRRSDDMVTRAEFIRNEETD
jgi:formate hydrogenlyase subunit 6/NADH:ubiquinone oxidoreductase subunit I